jgi:hypothetical protein
LCKATRAVDVAIFGFGRLLDIDGRHGRIKIPEYRLHLQVVWRIVRGGQVLVGYADWRCPPRGSAIRYWDFVQ